MKPSIPKGTRDFGPTEMVRRNYIFNTIKTVFERFGYLPIETPAMEKLETLMGKYGEEGDRLIFKVLNSGDFLAKADTQALNENNSEKLARSISEKALRYDLTVPFARYVVQHQNEITFPFKRYQIQPVWRADRPQKGRYREFYQCDVDVIGSDSLFNELELIQTVDEVFTRLKLTPVTIKLNNRKILSGLAEVIGEPDKIIPITVALDKLDKIGAEKVNEELLNSGISEAAVERLQPIMLISGSNEQKLHELKEILPASVVGMKGIEELEWIFNACGKLNIRQVEFELTLARGLNYYTGAIFEVTVPEFPSICGGGRYDDLAGIFGLPGVSGVGVSFGADRIYDVLLTRDLFPETVASTTEVMFANFGEQEADYCLIFVSGLRQAGINTELYPDAAKVKKQMMYANQKNIPYVVLMGQEEMKSGCATVKIMESGEQKQVNTSQLVHFLKSKK